MRRRRWRTAVLWGGGALCVLIVVLFVFSGWWMLGLQVQQPQGLTVRVTGGVFEADFGSQLGVIWLVLPGVSKMGPGTIPARPSWPYWNSWHASDPYFLVPLYAYFLAVAFPTLLVWRFVPKFPRGHCRRCGYNLTGLSEARCPECGQPFERMTRGVA